MEFYNEKKYYDDIYNDREKYNLAWAFKNAQEKIDFTFSKVCSCEKTGGCKSLKEAFSKKDSLTNSQKKVVGFAKRTKRLSRIFSNMQQLLTLIEVILSVLLVMGISNLSHHSESMIESEWLSIIVVVLFALFKVFIEKLLLQPQFEAWGWRAYHKSYQKLFETLELAYEALEHVNDITLEDNGILTSEFQSSQPIVF